MKRSQFPGSRTNRVTPVGGVSVSQRYPANWFTRNNLRSICHRSPGATTARNVQDYKHRLNVPSAPQYHGALSRRLRPFRGGGQARHSVDARNTLTGVCCYSQCDNPKLQNKKLSVGFCPHSLSPLFGGVRPRSKGTWKRNNPPGTKSLRCTVPYY